MWNTSVWKALNSSAKYSTFFNIHTRLGVSYWSEWGAKKFKHGDEFITGVFSQRDIRKGELLCSVHRFAQLSDDTLDAMSFVRLGVRLEQKLARLSLFLIREQHRSVSRWTPYISIVREHDVSNVPIMYVNTPRFDALSADVRESVTKQYHTLVRLYTATKKLFRHMAIPLSLGVQCDDGSIGSKRARCSLETLNTIYSWDEFLRVSTIVTARSWIEPKMIHRFSSSNHMEYYQRVMVPYIDMINFGPPNVEVFADILGTFRMSAKTAIPRHTEILWRYNNASREQILKTYGINASSLQLTRHAHNQSNPRRG